jgi:hypothetical protein
MFCCSSLEATLRTYVNHFRSRRVVRKMRSLGDRKGNKKELQPSFYFRRSGEPAFCLRFPNRGVIRTEKANVRPGKRWQFGQRRCYSNSSLRNCSIAFWRDAQVRNVSTSASPLACPTTASVAMPRKSPCSTTPGIWFNLSARPSGSEIFSR